MNRGLNLPSIQKIMNEFEKESSMMDMKEEMMSDAVDDVMDAEEDEEEEGDKILKEVLDEIGVDLSQKACPLRFCTPCTLAKSPPAHRCPYWHCCCIFATCQQAASGSRRISTHVFQPSRYLKC